MTEQLVMVGMGQLVVSNSPNEVLAALGLGSCVAVCAYDALTKLAGMIHVVLPTNIATTDATPAKSAELGVPRLIDAMVEKGSARCRLRIAIAGGANVLTTSSGAGLDIGTRNIAAVKAALEKTGLKCIADHVGGNSSRTVRLKVASGEVTLKTLRDGENLWTRLGS
jgi:chemotaxis protein CheD